jgi:hypothetical protein
LYIVALDDQIAYRYRDTNGTSDAHDVAVANARLFDK